MSLRGLIETVRSREKTLRVYNVADDTRTAIEEGLTTRNVAIEPIETASGRPATTVVLLDGETPIAIADATAVQKRLDGTEPAPTTHSFDQTYLSPRSDSTPTRNPEPTTPAAELLAAIPDRTFLAYDTTQMIYLSREIEDRAWRVGTGTLYAGFQRVSAIHDQHRRYRRLVERGVTVHVYAGTQDTHAPQIDGLYTHFEETEELQQSWFVIFDGGGHEQQKTALIAQRQSETDHEGVLTDNPQLIDDAITYLQRQYGEGNQITQQDSEMAP